MPGVPRAPSCSLPAAFPAPPRTCQAGIMQALQSRARTARCLRSAQPGWWGRDPRTAPTEGRRCRCATHGPHAPHTARGSEGESSWILSALRRPGVALEAMDGDLPPQLAASPAPPCLVPSHLSWLPRRIPAPANHPRQTRHVRAVLLQGYPPCPAGKGTAGGEKPLSGARQGLESSRRGPEQPWGSGTPGFSQGLQGLWCFRADHPQPSAGAKGGSGTRTLLFRPPGVGIEVQTAHVESGNREKSA